MAEILNYKLTLEVLGPLFIGSGEEIKKAEYVHSIKDNKIYVMNPLKMFNGLKELNLLKEYEKAIIKEPRAFNLYNFIKDYNIKLSDYKKWAAYSYDVDPKSNFSKTHIMSFVKDAYYMPYIPGSSLKGAIKNAFLNAYLTRTDKFEDLAQSVKNADFKGRNNYMKAEENNIKVRALHSAKRKNEKKEDIKDIANDIFYGIRISDSEPIGLENIVICQKQDILPNGKIIKHNEVQRECLKPGTKVTFEVTIDTKIFKYDGEKLCKIIKLMYNNINKVFLSSFNVNVKPESGNLIYVGGGVGFLSKTVIYSLFKNKNEAVNVASVILDNTDAKGKPGKHKEDPKKYGISPHTRKCTTYDGRLYDFGLCRIDFQPMQ